MSAPYNSVQHALSRAFSAPIPKISGPSIWATSVRGYGELTAMDKIALDAIVQTIAVNRCRPASVQTFRIMWEANTELVLEAMQERIQAFRLPSRRPPDEFCVAVIQKWAGRRVLKVPIKSDRKWAKEFSVDHRTVGRARLELTQQLQSAFAQGIRVMDSELASAGLIPSRDGE